MPEPLVSVIMPVRDGLCYLAQAVDSILSQTYRHLEFIVWDDGSREPVLPYLMGVRDARLRIFRGLKNLGLTRRLNQCLGVARGEVIARQDADDWSLPERLEKQLARLHKGAELVGCWAYSVNADGKRVSDYYLGGEARCPEGQIAQRLQTGNCLCDAAVMYTKRAADAIGPYDEMLRIGQAYNYSLRLAQQYPVGVVPEELYVRRKHPRSVRTLETDIRMGTVDIGALCRERARTHPIIRSTNAGRACPILE